MDATNKLPKVEAYDQNELLAIRDAVSIIDHPRCPDDEATMRALFSLYGLEPIAERKTPGTRGRGLHLYRKTDVEHAVSHYLSYFSSNS